MSASAPLSNHIAQRLRAARELRDLSQCKLADRAKLQASAVSHFETGTRKPSVENLRKLADALEVTTDYLLGRVPDPVGLAGAERLHRNLGHLTGSERKTAEDMIELLANRALQRKYKSG